MKKMISVMAVLALGACASIVKGSHQEVNVGTNTTSTGQCTITDKKNKIYEVSVPGRVTLNRGDGPLKVHCVVSTGEGNKVVDEEIEPWTIANVILGGIIGIGVDSYTGAYQRFPEDINVNIVALPQGAGAVPPATSDAPTYAR